MSEEVIRHRGDTRDSRGQYSGGTKVTLIAREVAPGGGARVIRQARDGETVACTVYFDPGWDVQDGDDLTVRGTRYRTIVNGWCSSGAGGLEVVCTRGQG